MNIEQIEFLKFVRTKMVFSLRLRSQTEETQPVHIKSSEIDRRFFHVRDRKFEIEHLVHLGELSVTQKGKAFYYEALKPGAFDLTMLSYNTIPTDIVTQTMLKHLKNVSLPSGAASTEYFDLFLKYKLTRPDLFFKIDSFCGRVHTPVTNFHRTHRPALLLYNEETTSLDVTTMQPLLLGKILLNEIGDNEYSTWINEGQDIYLKLQAKANLSTRDNAKKKFFEILFSKPSNSLSNMFGQSNWINWINEFKAKELPSNPHNETKPHSNLAWLLQTTEVNIMRKIWEALVLEEIPFLSIHDEIITIGKYLERVESIMTEILSTEFIYHKINTEKKVLLEPTLSTLATPKPVLNNPECVFENRKQMIEHIYELQNGYEMLANAGLLKSNEINVPGIGLIVNTAEFIESTWDSLMAGIGKSNEYSLVLKLTRLYLTY
jgi:hypothetical protein